MPWSLVRGRSKKDVESAGQKSSPVKWAYGLSTIFEDQNPVVDIIFVHGLNGDPIDTYTCPALDGSTCFWIKDLLPGSLQKEGISCRILSYGYNANTHSGPISIQSVWDHGQQFLSHLVDTRLADRMEERPIVIVAYSLGGLVVKSALVSSHLSSPASDPNLKAFSLSTYAVFWLGVPHRGADNGIIDIAQIFLRIVAAARQTSSKTIDFMDPDNEALKGLLENFNRINHLFRQRSFWELYETPVKVRGVELKQIQVVPKDSAIIPGQPNTQPTGINKNHSTLMKYTGENDPDFVTMSNALVLEMRGSFKRINDNWANWKRELNRHVHNSQRLSTNWPFPPDHRFRGRKGELEMLEASLQGSDTLRTTAITGPGGVGKTSLVLHYAYSNQKSYSFIIWINARSRSSTEDSFIWILEQLIRIAAEDAPQKRPDFTRIAQDLQIQGFLSSQGELQINSDAQDQRNRAVESVKRWLASQPDYSWLVVFDEHDTLNFRLRDFFARCNWGNYIITSRRPDVAGYATSHYKLGGLAQDDALEVLLAESERDRQDQDVLKASETIISMLEYHPLAIDSAAVYLRCRPFISLERYIEIFQNKMRETRPQELLEGKDRLWPDYTLTCMTTFEISEEAVCSESPNASKLLQLCSWLDKDNIWIPYLRKHASALGKDASSDDIDDYVALLWSYSLVRPKVGKDNFSIHAVIHIWGRERLPSNLRMSTMLDAFDTLLHAPYRYQGGIVELLKPEDYSMQKSALGHLEYMLDVADEYFGVGSLRCAIESQTFNDQKMRNEILSAVDESFSHLRNFRDASSFDPALHHRSSPLCLPDLWAQKHHEEFKSLQQRAILILQSVSGILLEQNRLRSATRFQLRLLLFELAFEDKYLEVLAEPETFMWCISSSLILVARLFHLIGEMYVAKQLLLFAVNDFGTRYPIPSDIEQQGQMTLTMCLQDLGEAISTNNSERLLDIDGLVNMLSFRTNILNEAGEPQEMTATLEGVKAAAIGLGKQQHYEDSRAIFEQLYEKRKEALPAGMADYLLSCIDLANSMRLEGAFLKRNDILHTAKSLLEETRPEMEKMFGENDSRTLRCITCLASIHEYLCNADEAERYFSQALVMYKDVEANLLDKLSCQRKLAYMRYLQKRYHMAELQQRQCLCTSTKLTSVDHASTLRITIDWARSLLELGHISEAGNLFVYALEEKLRQDSTDRAVQIAWSGLGEIVKLMEERGFTERASQVKKIRQRYETAIITSMIQQSRLTDAGLSVPEYGITLPVQIMQNSEKGDAGPSDAGPFQAGPSEPVPSDAKYV